MGKKTVSVTIANNTIACVPDRLPMGQSNNQDIEWTIDSAGWTFPANGIVIKSDPNGQFSDGGKESGNDRKFKWKDKNTDRNEYKYIVNVTNSANNPPNLSLDPIIVNEA